MSDQSEQLEEEEFDFEQINAEIIKYKDMIAENPNNYEAHKELIRNLRLNQDFDALKQARLEFAKELPLEQEVWLEWLSDEKQLVTTVTEKIGVVELYCTAVKDYNSIDIWVDFLEYLIQEYQDEDWISVQDIRKYCNTALEMVGLNFEEGHLVWNIVKDFQIMLLDRGLAELDDIRKFFLERLSTPHADLENTFGSYSSFESNYGENDYAGRMRNASNIVTSTRKVSEKRELKEEELRKSEHSLDCYFEYLDALKREYYKGKNTEIIKEIKSLYWRAIKRHFWNPTIWISLLGFLMDGGEISSDYLVYLATRAIKNSASCMVSPELWVFRLLAEEMQSSTFGDNNDTFTNSINILHSVGDYAGILLARVISGTRVV